MSDFLDAPDPPINQATQPDVPDRIAVSLPRGSRVLICSDLHLSAPSTTASRLVAADLCNRLAAVSDMGAIVLNGDCFELLAAQQHEVGLILDAHPAFEQALRDATAAGCRLIVMAGNHDGRLAWDQNASSPIVDRLGGQLCLAADLIFETSPGPQVVHVEHGHRFDPANAFADPRQPLDTPFGHHIVEEVVPVLERQSFLHDVAWLDDLNDFPQFLGSRVVYRQLLRRWWLLLVPSIVALLTRTPLVVRAMSSHATARRIERWFLVGGVGLIVDLALMVIIGLVIVRRAFTALAGSHIGPRGPQLNDAPRTTAEALCAEGFAGFVTGHTHQPELTSLGSGFYANSGCGVKSVSRRPGRLGLPPVFDTSYRRTWIELEATHQVSAQLWLAETPTGQRLLVERIGSRRPEQRSETPTVVAELPGGSSWPLRHHGLADAAARKQSRRVGAIGVLVIAVIGVLSSISPPLRSRLHWLAKIMPIGVPQAASSSLAFASVALALMARGMRRGMWTAWVAACALLAASVVLNVTKGVDIEEAMAALVVLIWLIAKRRHFQVRPGVARLRRTALLGIVGAAVATAVSAVLVFVVGARRQIDRDESLLAMVERLAGKHVLPLPSTSPFVGPALTATGISLVGAMLWRLFGPSKVPTSTDNERREDRERARQIIAIHGGDTLAYFALRDDKTWFFSGETVVAYAVRNSVCLVSPDPIGPADEREEAWSDFATFADRNGWSVAVVAAAPGWVPVYEAAGMRSVYMGDEAIVDCSSFTIEGGPMKSIRGAYNRVKKSGYTVDFADPATLPPEVVADLRAVMVETRQGDAERGFSMTLSRIFEPEDTGLLIAIARNAGGRADAFCHFVPAGDIDGWSLDLMRRRSSPDLPNGLTDFLIIETTKYIHAQHRWGLGLNFAVMRAVVAGEKEGGLYNLERRVLKKFSETMQVESLWRYNEKFRPYWRPRYVMLGSTEHAAAQGIAIADAEAIWELPIIGRFLGRRTEEAKVEV